MQHLQQLEKRLDDQIRATVQLLSDTRRELKSAQFTEFPSHHRPVSFDELLRFAKNVSKFTVPPTAALSQQTRVTNGVENVDVNEGGVYAGTPATQEIVKGEASITQPTPATSKNVPGSNVEDIYKARDTGIAWQTLADHHKAWLDQFAQAPFQPWPNEEAIRSGALSSMQTILEQGQNPEPHVGSVIETEKLPTSVDVDMANDMEAENGIVSAGPLSAIEKPRVARPAFEGFEF
jgi:hypothetical protein